MAEAANVNRYEAAVLYHPDLEVDLEKATGKVEKIFTDNGASVEATDNWGKRKLAYAIKGNEHAVYVIYQLDIPAGNIAKIEQTLNITDEVIRFLVTKPDLKKQAAAEAEKAEKLRKAEARRAEQGDSAER